MQSVKEQNRHWVHFSNCNLVMKYKYHELYNISLSVSIDRGAKPTVGSKLLYQMGCLLFKGKFSHLFQPVFIKQ